MQQHPTCPDCGSTEIVFDSSVIWNTRTAAFEVIYVSDRAERCEGCGNIHFYADWVDNIPETV